LDRSDGTSGGFPRTRFFDSLSQWLAYMRADYEEYICIEGGQ
jgi:hypothetical protein